MPQRGLPASQPASFPMLCRRLGFPGPDDGLLFQGWAPAAPVCRLSSCDRTLQGCSAACMAARSSRPPAARGPCPPPRRALQVPASPPALGSVRCPPPAHAAAGMRYRLNDRLNKSLYGDSCTPQVRGLARLSPATGGGGGWRSAIARSAAPWAPDCRACRRQLQALRHVLSLATAVGVPRPGPGGARGLFLAHSLWQLVEPSWRRAPVCIACTRRTFWRARCRFQRRSSRCTTRWQRCAAACLHAQLQLALAGRRAQPRRAWGVPPQRWLVCSVPTQLCVDSEGNQFIPLPSRCAVCGQRLPQALQGIAAPPPRASPSPPRQLHAGVPGRSGGSVSQQRQRGPAATVPTAAAVPAARCCVGHARSKRQHGMAG